MRDEYETMAERELSLELDAVRAERDRLRVVVEEIEPVANQALADLAREKYARRAIDRALLEAKAERDRLRAFVADVQQGGTDAVVAERDRLRARLDAERQHRIAAVDREVAIANERDRLRAVVDALRGFLFIEDEFEPTDNAAEVIADLRTMLAELDVSPITGGKTQKRAGALTSDDRAAPSSLGGSEPADDHGGTAPRGRAT